MDKLNYKNRNWLAGFVDGEGYIGIYKQLEKRKYRNFWRIMPIVVISNTNKPIMDYIISIINISSTYGKQIQKPNWKPCYKIRFTRKKAISFLKIVYPYLKVKKTQAGLCFKLSKTIHSNRNKKLHQRTITKREELYLKCKKLNKRGVTI